ncbi:MAG: hypothetical protein ACREM1_13130 [Longimicrobiales bacterium]
MADYAMVKEQLTDAMIEGGAALTRKLDEMGVPVTTALWMFDAEINEWRLIFASPEVSEVGLRLVLRKIDQAIDELGDAAAAVPYLAIDAMDADADLARRLRGAVRVDPEGKGVRVRRTVVNEKYIDDALVYRAA